MRRHPAGILLALALFVALVFGALNTVVAQQPAPTATALPATPAPTVAPPLPTSAPPTQTATPGVLPTPSATTWELIIELVFGKDRAAILSELWRRYWWLAVLAGVLLLAIPFVWKPVGERWQERIKAWLKSGQDKRQAQDAQRQKQAELAQSTSIYLERLQKDLARTEIIPIPNAYSAIDTRDYVPLQAAQPGAMSGKAIFAALDTDPPPRGLLLVGAAGSGKSHTLRYTALLLAESWPHLPGEIAAKLGLPTGASLLPIYVRLQDLPRCQHELQEQKGRAPSLLETIDRHLYHRRWRVSRRGFRFVAYRRE